MPARIGARMADDRCTAVHAGRRCTGLANHAESMNPTPHTFEPAQPWFIVAEISKNWADGESVANTPLLANQFERVIEHNRRRGYWLHSFQLHRMMTAPGILNETIIAVFERR